MRPWLPERLKRGNCLPAAVLIAAMALMLLTGCRDEPGPNVLRIGLAEQPRTLNIWLASDANSNKVLSQIYQPLYTMGSHNLEPVPWLAEQMPRFNPEQNTYTVRLRPARWSDGTPLSAKDVMFTGNLIKSFVIPRYAAKWEPVMRMQAPDDRTVVFYLKRPYAGFMNGPLATPVVPRHQWEPLAREADKSEKPLAALLNQRLEHPIGSGPFMLAQQDQDAYLYLRKNPYFFGAGLTIDGMALGPRLDGLLFKIYGTSDVAVLALKKGDIDMFWWGIQPGYLESLERRAHVKTVTSPRSAIYFLGFNLRRAPFNQAVLRKAAAILIDKDFIVQRILQGHGAGLATLIPEGNRQWRNPAIFPAGNGMTRKARILKAYELLRAAGYTWQTPPVDASGQVRPPSPLRLPDGGRMPEITILTPPADYDPHRAISGLMIQEWLHGVGIAAVARPMAFSALLAKIKVRHDFDAFILGYGRLPVDPDFLRTFFHSTNAGRSGWNISGYSNPEFDRLADQSRQETDPQTRQAIIFRMQTMLAEDLPYIPLYTPHLIEAVRTDRFRGWISMLEGIGNRWSFCKLEPVSPPDGGKDM